MAQWGARVRGVASCACMTIAVATHAVIVVAAHHSVEHGIFTVFGTAKVTCSDTAL